MSGELILIIEDNDKNRKLVRDVLQYHGYETLESESAFGGLGLAHDFRPALVLMDIQLPDMDGIAALHALRADPVTCSIPVLAITASAMSEEKIRIKEAGFDGYQQKPIAIVTFIQAVHDVLMKQGLGDAKS